VGPHTESSSANDVCHDLYLKHRPGILHSEHYRQISDIIRKYKSKMSSKDPILSQLKAAQGERHERDSQNNPQISAEKVIRRLQTVIASAD